MLPDKYVLKYKLTFYCLSDTGTGSLHHHHQPFYCHKEIILLNCFILS